MAALGRALMIYFGFILGLAGVGMVAYWIWLLTRAIQADPLWVSLGLWLLFTPFVVLGVALAFALGWAIATGEE